MRGLTCIIIFFSICTTLSSQQPDSTSRQGEIVSGEVIIEKNKQIVLPKADKVYQRGELKRFDTGPLSIDLKSFEPDLTWPPYKSDVPVKKVGEETPSTEYPNYLRLGYGNYGSPLAEVGIFKRLGSFDLQNKLRYESFASGPVNGANSGNSETLLDLSGTYTKNDFEVTPFITFSNQAYRFYGNTDRSNPGFSSEDLQKVRWSHFQVGTQLKGKSNSLKYSFTPKFSITSQNPEADPKLNAESIFGGLGSLEITIDKQFSAGFSAEGNTGNYESGLSYDRSLFQVNPWLKYKTEDFLLQAGFNVASGKSSETNQSGFYPDLKGEWFFENDWSLYAHLSGGVDWISVNNLLSENEFLDDSIQLLNVERKVSIGGGLKGSLLSNLYLDMNLTFSDNENLPFFVPSSSDSSRYTIIYDDESVQLLKLFSKLTYAPSNTSLFGLSMEVNTYSVSSLDRSWHKPAIIFRGFTSHNIKEKVLLSGTVLAVGGIRAPSAIDFGIENLETIIDLGFKANYIISNRASAFVETQNILNKEYERYLGYPVRGITFKVGAQYRF